MNLRIPHAPAMVKFLNKVVAELGSPVLSVEGWAVVHVDGQLFYQNPDHTEVGGPYPTLGALLQDAGHRVHVVWADSKSHELRWEVRAWGGAYFTVCAARLDAPSRHPTLEEARAAGEGKP